MQAIEFGRSIPAITQKEEPKSQSPRSALTILFEQVAYARQLSAPLALSPPTIEILPQPVSPVHPWTISRQKERSVLSGPFQARKRFISDSLTQEKIWQQFLKYIRSCGVEELMTLYDQAKVLCCHREQEAIDVHRGTSSSNRFFFCRFLTHRARLEMNDSEKLCLVRTKIIPLHEVSSKKINKIISRWGRWVDENLLIAAQGFFFNISLGRELNKQVATYYQRQEEAALVKEDERVPKCPKSVKKERFYNVGYDPRPSCLFRLGLAMMPTHSHRGELMQLRAKLLSAHLALERWESTWRDGAVRSSKLFVASELSGKKQGLALAHLSTTSGCVIIDHIISAPWNLDPLLMARFAGYRRGVGTSLIEAILAYAISLRPPRDVRVSPTAISKRFFEKMGFVEIESGSLELLMELPASRAEEWLEKHGGISIISYAP